MHVWRLSSSLPTSPAIIRALSPVMMATPKVGANRAVRARRDPSLREFLDWVAQTGTHGKCASVVSRARLAIEPYGIDIAPERGARTNAACALG